MRTIVINNCNIHLYSATEWMNGVLENQDSKVLGMYDANDPGNIYMLENQHELDVVHTIIYGIPSANKWEAILIHEYCHYLQHAKGCWDELIPLGVGSIPMTKAFKQIEKEEYWAIEAEAHWVMERPHLIKWKPIE